MMVMVMVNESTDLQTVNQLIKKYKNDTSYRVKSKISKFHGYSVKDLEMVRDEILARREGAKPLPGQLQEGRRRLGPAPRPERKESPRSPLECAVLRRRAAIDPQDNR